MLMQLLLLLLVVCSSVGVSVSARKRRKPNIVLVMMDDLGWGDVGYLGNRDVLTPHLDQLAGEYLQLDQYYTQPVCTPSRTALMTGKYPAKLGLQHETIIMWERRGVPLSETFLPEHLQTQGYQTHAVGKWHLGFYRWDYTPTRRGFDSFYGFYGGHQGYFSHWNKGAYDHRLDLHNNGTVNYTIPWNEKGTHNSQLYQQRIATILNQRDKIKPMFLYFAMANTHVPVEPPRDTRLKERYEAAGLRYTDWAGLVTNGDDQIGFLMDSLREAEMFNDTVVILVSDNGGYKGHTGDLRGCKRSLYEGGIRAPAVIAHPSLRLRGKSTQLLHVTDLHPLILHLGKCGFKVKCDLSGLAGSIDGIDPFKAIFKASKSRRKRLLVNVDQRNQEAAIRVAYYKLVVRWDRNAVKRTRAVLKQCRRNTIISVWALNENPDFTPKPDVDLVEMFSDECRFYAELYDLNSGEIVNLAYNKRYEIVKRLIISELQLEVKGVVPPSPVLKNDKSLIHNRTWMPYDV